MVDVPGKFMAVNDFSNKQVPFNVSDNITVDNLERYVMEAFGLDAAEQKKYFDKKQLP